MRRGGERRGKEIVFYRCVGSDADGGVLTRVMGRFELNGDVCSLIDVDT